ncbi:Putative Acyl-coenzyme A oxidase [Rhizopus microsporus]|nr:Putative Acyl-coenzyme A oxidase [Rhizopus microsporus]
MSAQAPKDMERERQSASFSTEALSYFWMGGKEKYIQRQDAYDYIKHDPELVVQPPRNILDFTKEEWRKLYFVRLHIFINTF